jgi:hypothetical protein
VGASNQGTLAEIWDGSHWTIQPTPNPADSHGSEFYDISCTSPTDCTAVGNYHNSHHANFSLAETRTG